MLFLVPELLYAVAFTNPRLTGMRLWRSCPCWALQAILSRGLIKILADGLNLGVLDSGRCEILANKLAASLA